jgi:hypothetical protein
VIPGNFRVTMMYHDTKLDRPSNDAMDLTCRPGWPIGIAAWPYRAGIAPLRITAATLMRLWGSGQHSVRLPRRWRTYRHLTVISPEQYEGIYHAEGAIQVGNN